MTGNELRDFLNEIYGFFNDRRYVHPDPLEFLYRYDRLEDREIAGMIASSLAYGRVVQICRSVETVLNRLGPAPSDFILATDHRVLRGLFPGFQHRFTSGTAVGSLLSALKSILEEYGSIEGFFSRENHDVLPVLKMFTDAVNRAADCGDRFLIPCPSRRSACKRLHLFMRWMIRRDRVDPGGWECLRPEQLITPIDTHMHAICIKLGITQRRTADLTAAQEITGYFRTVDPADPVKFDFGLTRLGMHPKYRLKFFPL